MNPPYKSTKFASNRTRNIDEYRSIHQKDPKYGRSSEKLIPTIDLLIKDLKSRGAIHNLQPTILDFGCGKSHAAEIVGTLNNMRPIRYDPAIPELEKIYVSKADIVINTDVLEHLDLAEVNLVLQDIRSMTENAFFNIATTSASKHLSTGENAHVTVHSPGWWKRKIEEFYRQAHYIPSSRSSVALTTWRPSLYTRTKIFYSMRINRLKREGEKILKPHRQRLS